MGERPNRLSETSSLSKTCVNELLGAVPTARAVPNPDTVRAGCRPALITALYVISKDESNTQFPSLLSVGTSSCEGFLGWNCRSYKAKSGDDGKWTVPLVMS